MSIWWCPAPREGEIVPDHGPVDLTPYVVGASFSSVVPPPMPCGRRPIEAAMRDDEKRGAALAAGFTKAQWDEQRAMVARCSRAHFHAVDVPGTALGLLLEFGEPTEPSQAERRRFMAWLRAAGILRDDPG